jgi:uncharacterized protein YbjT (DUF2867 family)
MKIVIIGGTGLIGSKLAKVLRGRGHDVLAASPNTGVNTVTGEGLAEALAGADVVVDVSNSPSFEDKTVLEFFETSGRNLLAAEKVAGVRHHVALSVVGAERLPGSGYMRAKMAQEALIRASTVPYSIVHATQFFEFTGAIAKSAQNGGVLRLSTAWMQPIATDDVVEALADVALSPPLHGTVEIAGPERVRMPEIVRRYLREVNDSREVVGDPQAPYFGAVLDDESLVPAGSARIGVIRFESWLGQQRKTQ